MELSDRPIRIALVWAGEPNAELRFTPDMRYTPVAEALRRLSVEPVPVVYKDEMIDAVLARLLNMDGVLVWIDPIVNGRDRSKLDAMLRDVASTDVFVSAHPDVILKMGTKQVLYDTRHLGWGTDTHVYPNMEDMRTRLPAHLASGQARVLKQYRGNGGNGVWRLQLVAPEASPSPATRVRLRHAQRGSVEAEVTLADCFATLEPYFTGSGRMIDQPYKDRLPEGMIRCYFVHDRVVGFGHQAINALYPAPAGAPADQAPPPGPRLYHPPTKPEFQALKRKLESEWVAAMQETLDIATGSLPIIWDADFLLGPKDADGHDTYVLCEINVSSVSPFPDEALEPLARAAAQASRQSHSRRTSASL